MVVIATIDANDSVFSVKAFCDIEPHAVLGHVLC